LTENVNLLFEKSPQDSEQTGGLGIGSLEVATKIVGFVVSPILAARYFFEVDRFCFLKRELEHFNHKTADERSYSLSVLYFVFLTGFLLFFRI